MSCRRCIATVTIRSPDPTRLGPPIAPCACSSCVDRRAFPSRFLCVCLSVCACLWCPLAVRCGGRAAPPQRRRSCAVSDCTRTHQCSFIPPPPPRCSSPPSLVVGCIYSERRPCGGCSGCGTSVVCNLSVKSKRLRSDASPLWLLEAAGRPRASETLALLESLTEWVAACCDGSQRPLAVDVTETRGLRGDTETNGQTKTRSRRQWLEVIGDKTSTKQKRRRNQRGVRQERPDGPYCDCDCDRCVCGCDCVHKRHTRPWRLTPFEFPRGAASVRR